MKILYRWPLCLMYVAVFACGQADIHDGPSANLRNLVDECIETHAVHGNPLFDNDGTQLLIDTFDEVHYVVSNHRGYSRVEFGSSNVVPDGPTMGCTVATSTSRIFGLDYYIYPEGDIIRLFEPYETDGVSNEPLEPDEPPPEEHTYSIRDFQLGDAR